MKNLKTRLFVLIFFGLSSRLFSQGIPPKIREDITEILMKPVPSGSTLRYENLVKYLKKLDISSATKIIDQIENKTPFGESFYHRMSHSTVDKKILPLLKDIEGGVYLEDETTLASNAAEKTDKPKSKKPVKKKTIIPETPENETIAKEIPKIKIENIKVKKDYTLTNILSKSWKLEVVNSKIGARTDEVFFEENHNYTIDELAEAIFISSDWSKYYELNKISQNAFILKQANKSVTGKDVIENEIFNKL